jgi:hypothetical protein
LRSCSCQARIARLLTRDFAESRAAGPIPLSPGCFRRSRSGPGLPMRAVRCVQCAVGQAEKSRHAARRLPGTGKDCAASRMAASPASGACGAWPASTPAHSSAGPSDACQRSCKLLSQSVLRVEKSRIVVDLFRFLETRSPQSVACVHAAAYEPCLSQSKRQAFGLLYRITPSFRMESSMFGSEYNITTLMKAMGINCVLDVGANSGQFGGALFQRGFPGIVVSFEPLNDCYQDLTKKRERVSQLALLQLGSRP